MLFPSEKKSLAKKRAEILQRSLLDSQALCKFLMLVPVY